MENNELILKSYEYAKSLTETLITVSTGVIGLSITFSKELIQNVSTNQKRALFTSWILFLFSITAGIVHLMALTGELRNNPKVLDFQDNALVFAGIQQLFFGAATLFFIITGIITINRK